MREAEQRDRQKVVDPRTGIVFTEVELLPESAVPGIAGRAARAFQDWQETPLEERCALVAAMARLLGERIPRLAPEFSREHGKTRAEAEAELARAVETLHWSAERAKSLVGPAELPERGGMERRLETEAAGPVLAIVPWNFPAVTLARKLGPALSMGCSVVVKAPETTPRVMAAFAEAAADAGLPVDAVQVVHATPTTAEALVRRREFRVVSFTGSTRVGRHVAAAAAEGLSQCVLELGGHAPAVVTAEADLDAAARTLAAAKFASTGQSCAAPSRFLIHRDVHDAFVDRFLRYLPRLDHEARGGGLLGDMGPLHTAAHRDVMHELVTDAVAKGATVRAGGELPGAPGFYYPATVLTGTPRDARILREEPFGPIAPFVAYTDDEECVTLAGGTDYALSAYVFGDLEHARELARRIDAGSVSINCAAGAAPDAPLGGRLDSGYGYEGGDQGLLAFGRLKILQHAPAAR
ncbi:succinate-semialdehyde dehydrogenase/glutarate-semialdehyde dehydrogenase [Streptomyces griseochromogenes]|uniref:Aldehyde dehydrogenase n=1 Tax=Streptomyces griseochromogenes TaxID=68214 RepID=A0A1B1B834_9ACTN|nr:aldehyde dehydrogenase family protein [Streptomyces griseochromogenes]ANP54941.1 aldehyde dehydrogenase [Streptomyces griseochromogenes]MBP2050672.1 succinate-semialdehyde dehydrogenase/glutarate-semialdehyde dehydrogenase [Streptomyces griseochromogenes]